jgi:multidrug transporter EmrE-like cation transporter
MAYVYLVLAFSFNAAANILLKIGSARGVTLHGPLVSILLLNWQAILGCGLFVVNVLFYFLALRALPLSIAYPIMVGMSFIIINAYALLELKEGIATLQLFGYALIIVGLVLVVSRA